MSQTLSIVGGINEPIEIQFKDILPDSFDEPAPFDASGKTVSLQLRGADGALVTTSGKVEWVDASISFARFNRLTTDVVASNQPYRARWFVTDPDGTQHPYPSTHEADYWLVGNPT